MQRVELRFHMNSNQLYFLQIIKGQVVSYKWSEQCTKILLSRIPIQDGYKRVAKVLIHFKMQRFACLQCLIFFSSKNVKPLVFDVRVPCFPSPSTYFSITSLVSAQYKQRVKQVSVETDININANYYKVKYMICDCCIKPTNELIFKLENIVSWHYKRTLVSTSLM